MLKYFSGLYFSREPVDKVSHNGQAGKAFRVLYPWMRGTFLGQKNVYKKKFGQMLRHASRFIYLKGLSILTFDILKLS